MIAAGTPLSALLMYWLGSSLGGERLKSCADRYGRRLMTAGSAAGTALLVYVGYALGCNFEQVGHSLGPATTVVLIAVVWSCFICGD